jgi:avidin family protein
MKIETSLARALAGAGTAVDFSGTWRNELGSTMELSQNGDQLDGVYHSKVSSTGGTTDGALSGYCNGDLIAFTVHWNEFQAITSWVGQVSADQVTISTLWQMTKQVDPGDEWASINAGFDTFDRMV